MVYWLVLVNQESQSPEKLVFVSILPKQRHVSVFFILKIQNAVKLQIRWEGAFENRDWRRKRSHFPLKVALKL